MSQARLIDDFPGSSAWPIAKMAKVFLPPTLTTESGRTTSRSSRTRQYFRWTLGLTFAQVTIGDGRLAVMVVVLRLAQLPHDWIGSLSTTSIRPRQLAPLITRPLYSDDLSVASCKGTNRRSAVLFPLLSTFFHKSSAMVDCHCWVETHFWRFFLLLPCTYTSSPLDGMARNYIVIF